MAGKQGAFLVLATLAAIVGICSAASLTVGDKTGWTIPPSPSFYTTWAGKQTIKVGDVLVFNFPAGTHTVAPVSKADYDACNSANPISPAMTTAPANITVSSAGTHYYICTITGHCSVGQKLSITATSAATAPAPKPAKKTPAAPAPTPSAATAPTASPPSTTTPGSPAMSPAGGATTPSTSTTAGGPSTDGATASPPQNSFATPMVASASLLSLVSIAAALLF